MHKCQYYGFISGFDYLTGRGWLLWDYCGGLKGMKSEQALS